ncbi:cytochrome C assembly family protein [Glaciecola sp. 1036]|uniref:cytochrome C assembly family protein n=1 Tax=Alteromonadaceae TaxID=72275 RepID=UPI003D053FCD
MTLLQLTSGLSILCYLASSGLLVRRFFSHTLQSAKKPIGVLLMGIICHLVLIVFAIAHNQGEKLSLTFVLLVIAWLISFSMFVANKYIRNLVFLPIVSLSAAIFVSLYALFPITTGIDANMSSGMIVHISLSMLAFGFLGISALYALQLSYINYQLKHKRHSLLKDDLPPLMAVEEILYKLMTVGSVILAAALISGFAFVPSMLAHGYAHKTILSTLALCIFAGALIYHKIRGLRARTAVWINIIGVSVLALSYFGSRLVQEFLLG